MEIPRTNWIWIPGWEVREQKEACLVRFRKSLNLEKVQGPCRIHISADSRYKLYVNGVLIESGPSKGDAQIWFYDDVDIFPFLKEGENVLAAEVLRYPLDERNGNFGIFRTKIPGLYVEEQNCGGNENEILGISADASWKCCLEKNFKIVPENMFFAPLQILEERQGQREDAGWKKAGYDDSGWKPAFVYNKFEVNPAVSPGNLQARTIPYMQREPGKFSGIMSVRQSASQKDTWEEMLAGRAQVVIPANSHEIVEINAGEEMTGFLSLRMAGGTGAIIKLLASEGYVEKSEDENSKDAFRSPQKGNRCDCEQGVLDGYTDTYKVCGYGQESPLDPEVYEPFWFRTFRFIQLDVKTGEDPLVITGFDYLETGYPLQVKTRVETSDETLEPVWDISLRTLRRCMHETYMDCPFYEQLQYAMDSRSQILYTYMISADDRLARKCMDDFRRSQRYDGMINCSYPTCVPNIIPGFSIYYIMMLYDHMMFFGDKELLRQHAGAIDGILEYFNHCIDERGLVGKNGGLNVRDRYWSFIDWTPQWDETTGMPGAGLYGPITMESMLYTMGLMHAAKIMSYLGREGVAGEYRARAAKVREAVNKHCTDEEGMYLDGPGVKEYSQHCQVFAVLTNMVTPGQGREYLRRTLKDKETYAPCSVAMAYYLFRAMEKTGMYEETENLWELWRDMVKKNLTTCVEDNVHERSDCHAWGALALYELPAAVLGVRPGEPGFAKIIIAPQQGYFTWAKGEVATRWGTIKVEWEQDTDGTLKLKYEAPEGVPVEVISGEW